LSQLKRDHLIKSVRKELPPPTKVVPDKKKKKLEKARRKDSIEILKDSRYI
jgi:hypothetical protein